MAEASRKRFAIITGTGFSSFGGEAEGRQVTTAYGPPSGPVRQLSYGAETVFVLGRHGDDLAIPPHRINYRANLMALKLVGADSVIAVNTVGVIGARRYPGQLAVPDQLIDYTYGRDHSIYDGDSATLNHVDFTEPFSAGLRQAILAAARAAEVECHDGGVYGATQGPRLETAAEVDKFERDGVDYLGMTAMPEAVVARELGLRYACLSLIVNRAAGRGDGAIHEDIEANTLSAKMQAIKVLKHFFGPDIRR
ncbi:MAG: S-methyl-5'-thioinosine phosphorylase [Woeseiaceae bacterium]